MVVLAGETLCVPEAAGLTAPIPWSIDVLLQLAVVHERVEGLPVTTDVGRAEKDEMVQSANTVMVTDDVGD